MASPQVKRVGMTDHFTLLAAELLGRRAQHLIVGSIDLDLKRGNFNHLLMDEVNYGDKTDQIAISKLCCFETRL